MTLLEDVQEHYKENNYPPEGDDLDYIKVDDEWVKGDTVTELVDERDLGDLRWGTQFANVYKRGDEYVQVTDVRPATEMQDWGDYGDPEISVVEPHTRTITITEYKEV